MSVEFRFTDRHGGRSGAPYDSFNLAFHTGDDPETVEANRSILQKRLGIDHIVWMDQVHGDNIEIVTSCPTRPVPSCDALVTKAKGVALAVMVAYCIPVLIYDPHKEIVAAVHAGRNGTFLEIVPKTVKRMEKSFGSRPEELWVRMGPSIRRCCYEVSPEIAEIAQKNFGEQYVNGRSLDLQSLNRDQLLQLGTKPENIGISPICTCCDPNYFSYRREDVTGRFAGMVWMI